MPEVANFLKAPHQGARLDQFKDHIQKLDHYLKALYKNKQLSRKQFKQRTLALRRLEGEASLIKLTHTEHSNIQKFTGESGLPPTADLDSTELKLKDEMLGKILGEHRLQFTSIRDLFQRSQKNPSRLRTQFMMTKIRRLLRNQESIHQQISAELNHQEDSIDRLDHQLQSYPGKGAEGGLTMLMRIYQHIDHLSGRVLRLKHRINLERHNISELQRKIHSPQKKMKLPNKHSPAPETTVLLETTKQLQGEDYNPIALTGSRLEAAKKFLEACLDQTPSQPRKGATGGKL